MSKLNGWKTYVLAALGVIYAVSGFFTGHVDANTAFEIIGASLGMASLRHGISTTIQQ